MRILSANLKVLADWFMVRASVAISVCIEFPPGSPGRKPNIKHNASILQTNSLLIANTIDLYQACQPASPPARQDPSKAPQKSNLFNIMVIMRSNNDQIVINQGLLPGNRKPIFLVRIVDGRYQGARARRQAPGSGRGAARPAHTPPSRFKSTVIWVATPNPKFFPVRLLG